MKHLMAVVLAGLLGAGCLGAWVEPASVPPKAPSLRPPVVALLDTGANPYHVAFAAAPGRGVEAWAGEFNATPVRLSANGSFEERRAQDRAFWEGVEDGRLYAFEGTRLLGVSISHTEGYPRILDDAAMLGHGTKTTSLVAREAPEGIVVLVQLDTLMCDPRRPRDQCPILTEVAAGIAWAARQPWIDVISMSIGYPLNPPLLPMAREDTMAFVEAVRLAHASGKTIVAAAGNTVAPPLASQFAGLPEVIAVGGLEPAQGGDAVQAAKAVDVLANFTDRGAAFGTVDDEEWGGGTSLAAPIVAGVLAEALRRVRLEIPMDPLRERDALRDALNASALLVAPTAWRPMEPASDDAFRNLHSRSLPVLTPAQQGWGYVHGGLAGEIARRVLEDDLAPPPEKAFTAAYMAQHQGLRERYWSW